MVFSCRGEFVSDPISQGLLDQGWTIVPYDPLTDNEQLQSQLGSGAIDIVLTSPLEYARSLGIIDYGLVPGLAVTMRGFAGVIRLLFGEGRDGIRTIATRRDRPYELLVTRMLLAEKYDLEPEFIQVDDDLPTADMLAVADAGLVAGDEAIFEAVGHRSQLDISDEWEDTVEESLPYLVAWGRLDSVSPAMIDSIIRARDTVPRYLTEQVARHPRSTEATRFQEACRRGDISYTLDADAVPSLETFYRYAFYHAAIQDIPAVKYVGEEA